MCCFNTTLEFDNKLIFRYNDSSKLINGVEMDKYLKFVDYVYSFYGRNGIYPMVGVTKKMITESTMYYLDTLCMNDFCGDSLDRERVRDIMINQFDLKFKY